ncbi:MAG: DUF3305 domain-containing protein [Rhodospirillaceae bacterium]|jgi:hypothetical protein|nr:DUF3305 domain-containing protein [Rhodospirillaceae bacterium]MBT5309771.1 DUF3305 domain-containing protein [Rhodospirillaceae bacterium]MBT6407681.1 DUF3305 domain-containing protein [Rhodospirillaceae bacterium]MBT7356684.1 DUF3305 domain-containing protein [Rhodospirillaceae bacterium]
MNTKDKSEIRIAETMPVGIVLERRDIEHAWQDHTWHVVDVLPGGEDRKDWQTLSEVDGSARFYTGTLTLELFRRETEGYKVNLSNSPPLVYVVLREGDEDTAHEMEPFMITVCPYEAQDYQINGEDKVEGVAMPTEIIAWLSDFIDRHHVDEPFVKRKQKRKTAEDAFGDGGKHRGRR